MEQTDKHPSGGAPAQQPLPLTEADYARLDALLDELDNPDAMIVEELDGFLVALACGAEIVPPEEYLPEILGLTGDDDEAGDEDAVADDDDPAPDISEAPPELLALIERHAAQVSAGLASGRFAPVLAHDEQGHPDGVAWAVGFLRGVEMRPDSWEAMLDEGEFADALDAAEALAASLDDDQPSDTGPISRRERDSLIDQMIADVADIHEFFRPFRKAGTTPQAMRVETVRREQPKTGRNDPCPCGSGKKYKLCCGR
jgi:uncharacterized protein